jgi:hypothetical protein
MEIREALITHYHPTNSGDSVGSLHANLDWLDKSIIDAVDVWEMKMFIMRDSLKVDLWIPDTLPDYATTNVTIRRAQNFKGFPNNTLLCWSNIHNGQVVQNGTIKQRYTGTKPKALTVKNIKVYSDTIRLRVELCNPLKSTVNSAACNSEQYEQGFPNPFSDNITLNIYLEEASKVQVLVYNLLGERVLFTDFGVSNEGENNFDLNTSGLDAGIYYVKVQSDDGEETYKVVKQ